MEIAINECRYKGCNFFIQAPLFQIEEVHDQYVVADMIPCKGNQQAHGILMCSIAWGAMNYCDIDMSVILALIGECTVTITKKTNARFLVTVAITEHSFVHNVGQTITHAKTCGLKIICLSCQKFLIRDMYKHDLISINLFSRNDSGVVSRNGKLAKFDKSIVINIDGDPIVGQMFSGVMGVFVENNIFHIIVLISDVNGHLAICGANITQISKISTFNEIYIWHARVSVENGESDISSKIEQLERFDIQATIHPSKLSSSVKVVL
jgi:succinyl-CoA synthetase alpha subunit